MWVHLAGELDIATTPQLERTLHDPRSRVQLVVLDLRELAFMDTSGVHAIVSAGIRARRLGRRLIVLRGPRDVDRIFALTGSSDDVEVRACFGAPRCPTVLANVCRSCGRW